MTDLRDPLRQYDDQSVMLIGDLHFRDRPPRNAVDTYVDDLFALLDWSIDYAIDNKIRTIVWAGDIFDHKQPSRTSHALVLRLLERVRRYVDMTEPYDGRTINELLIVVGNHDISNDVLDSVSEKQPLGILLAAGAKELNGWHPAKPLFGVPWQQRWFADGVLDEVMGPWRSTFGLDNDDVPPADERTPKDALLITHAPIFPDAEYSKIMYEAFPASAVAEAMGGAGNIFYGHIHDDHGSYDEGGVTFCNPGALSRGSASESNITRTIHLAVWTPGEFDGPHRDRIEESRFDIIDIPAKSAEETFRLAEVRETQASRATLDRFLKGLGTTVLDVSDKHSVIEAVRGREEVSETVRTRAITQLEESYPS